MHIDLVTHKPPSTGFGRYAAGLATALWRAGHTDVRLVHLDAPQQAVHVSTPDGRTTTPVHGPPTHPFLFLRRAWRQAAVQGPVHFTNQHLAWLPADHKIATVHDLYYLHHGPPLRRLQARLLYQGLRRAEGALVSCPAQADALAGFAPAVPAFIAPPGIDDPLRSPSRSKRSRSLLHVGAVDARKQVDLLLEAMADAAMPADTRFDQVGAPPSRQLRRLRRQAARQGLDDRVRWHGPLRGDQLRRQYEDAMVFALPSREEGFGYPAFEAMAAGTPVVASDIPTLRQLIGAHATLVPPHATAIAQAVAPLLEDARTWRHASRQALRCAQEQQWSNVVGRTVAAYESTWG